MLFEACRGCRTRVLFATICFGGAGGNNSLQKSGTQVPEQVRLRARNLVKNTMRCHGFGDGQYTKQELQFSYEKVAKSGPKPRQP
jgi:hypothetical protein